MHFKNFGCNTQRSDFTDGAGTTQMLSAAWSSEKCPCPWQGGVQLESLWGPFKPKPFCDSVISVHASVLRFGYKLTNLPYFFRGTKDTDKGRGSFKHYKTHTEAPQKPLKLFLKECLTCECISLRLIWLVSWPYEGQSSITKRKEAKKPSEIDTGYAEGQHCLYLPGSRLRLWPSSLQLSLWNNLHIYILPARQLTYGLN